MKFDIVFLLLLLVSGCKKVSTIPENTLGQTNRDSIYNEEDSINSSTNKMFDEDCIFDQATQTDDFLKGVKELEGYIWDTETKTAEIVLNDHWGLTITRGGCTHFTLSALFHYDRILDIENKNDEKVIFDSVIWITSLLSEFDGDVIKEVIENDKISITKENKFNYHINFLDVKLYELYYMSFNNNQVTTFEIGYYYN